MGREEEPLRSLHLLEAFAWRLANRLISSFHVKESFKVEKTLQNKRRNSLCEAATPQTLETADRRTESLSSVRPSPSGGSSACLSVTTATSQLQPLAIRTTQTKKKRREKKRKHPTAGRKVAWRTKEAFVRGRKSSGGAGKGTEGFDLLLTLRGYSEWNALVESSGREISQIYPELLLRQRRHFLRHGNEAKGGVKVGRGERGIGISQAPSTANQPRIRVLSQTTWRI